MEPGAEAGALERGPGSFRVPDDGDAGDVGVGREEDGGTDTECGAGGGDDGDAVFVEVDCAIGPSASPRVLPPAGGLSLVIGILSSTIVHTCMSTLIAWRASPSSGFCLPPLALKIVAKKACCARRSCHPRVLCCFFESERPAPRRSGRGKKELGLAAKIQAAVECGQFSISSVALTRQVCLAVCLGKTSFDGNLRFPPQPQAWPWQPELQHRFEPLPEADWGVRIVWVGAGYVEKKAKELGDVVGDNP